jgi:hypothetical protein
MGEVFFEGRISGLFGLTVGLFCTQSTHRVATAISGVHSITMEKVAQAGEGGGARPPPFTIFTVTYKVAVYDPTKRADTLPLYHLYHNVLCASQHGPLRDLQTHHLTHSMATT